MTNEEKRLLDLYAERAAVYRVQYEVMGALLDKCRVNKIICHMKWEDIYIYGGAYLGVFTWMCFNEYVNIKGIVDKKSTLYVPLKNVPIMSIEMMREKYNNEPVIITPLEYGNSIKEELITFVDASKVFFINELL